MLHGYKKSRYNIYDNLEFLGLDPYEQKHFCFGEGGGEGGNGDAPTADNYEDTTAFKDEDLDPSVDPDDPTSLSTDPPGLTAEEAEEAFAVADATGLAIGSQAYQDVLDTAVDLDAVQKQDMVFDLNLARDIAGKYGLEPTQVTPAFMDPTGVKTIGYRGPGSTKAAATEIGRGAARLGANLIEMYPSPLNLLATVAREEFDVKIPSLNLTDKVTSYFDSLAASQKQKNTEMSAPQGPPDATDIQGLVDISPLTMSERATQQVEAPASTPSFSDVYDVGLPDSGGVPLAPSIPSVPTVAPEPAAEVVTPEPRIRTAAENTRSILEGIYGKEITDNLLPPRTDLSRIV